MERQLDLCFIKSYESVKSNSNCQIFCCCLSVWIWLSPKQLNGFRIRMSSTQSYILTFVLSNRMKEVIVKQFLQLSVCTRQSPKPLNKFSWGFKIRIIFCLDRQLDFCFIESDESESHRHFQTFFATDPRNPWTDFFVVFLKE